MTATKKRLVAQAEQQNRAYPQYRGHWSGPRWSTGVIKRDVRTKMGDSFRRGDVVLVTTEPRYPECGPYTAVPFVTAYSFRTKVDTSIRLAWVAIEEGK